MNFMNLVRISPSRLLCCALLFSSFRVAAQVQPTFYGPLFTDLGSAAAVGDFNSDGKLDVIVSASVWLGGQQQPTVLLGNGDGTFTPGTTLSISNVYAVGDFNGDGKLDLLYQCTSGSSSWCVELGNGDGTFQPSISSNIGNVYPLAVADINGDGKPDAIGFYSGNFYVFLGNGDGTFTGTNISYPVTGAFALGDFNGDRKVDIAFANPGTVTVMMGNGDGTFRSPVTSTGVANPSGIASGDLNGDGHLDLVVSDSATYQTFSLLGNGDGTFQAPGHPVLSFNLLNLVLADVNHDGKLDLIGNSPGAVQIFVGEGNGGFSNSNSYQDLGGGNFGQGYLPPLELPITLIGDFNGDGNSDLVSGPFIYLGNGDGTFQGGPVVLPNSCPAYAAVADFNGDGKPDIAAIATAAPCYSSTTYLVPSLNILLGDGRTGFSLAQTYSFPSNVQVDSLLGASTIMSADLNGDGKQDLIIAFGGMAWGVAALLGNGDGSFGPPVVTTVGSTWYASPSPAMVVADFNGDHKSDLALAGEDDNVYVLMSNGDGTFAISQIDLGGTWSLVAGDFNGDGKIDLAVIASGGVALLLGNGDGTFQQPITEVVGSNGSLFTVGDFNADGHLDLVWYTTTYLGNGDGTFQLGIVNNGLPVVNGSPDIENLSITTPAVDLNGDGYLDIIGAIWQGLPDLTTIGLWAVLGRGDGTFTDGNPGAFGPPLAVADINMDTLPDILSTSGQGIAISLNTTPAKLALTIMPASVNFGLQTLGGNSSGSVVLKNTGSNAVNVTSIQVTTLVGGAAVFTTSQNCVATIAPGNSCTLTATFTPTATGAATGYITIVNNTAFSPQVITLAGTGEPALSISPASADFGTQALDSISSATAVLKNTSANPLYVTSIRATTLGGGGGAPVFNAAQTCATSIAPGGTCTLTITFAPTTIGAAMGNVSIADSIDSLPQVIPLAGTGAGVGLAVEGSNSVTVAAGGTATYSLSLGGAAWSGQASITCAALPKGASCSLPGPVSLSATQTSSVTLNITTTSRTLAALTPGQAMRWPWILAFLALGGTAFPRKILTKGYARYCLPVLACVLLVSLVCSCGGGGGNSSGATQQQNPNGTPAGTYQIAVTATSSFMNQSVNLTLNVQ